MAAVSEVGNRPKGLITIVGRARVEQHITPREPGFHLDHLITLDAQLLCHGIDLALVEGLTVGAGIGRCVRALVALLHGAQVEKQLALRFGGRHFHHTPVFQDIFMHLCLDPMQRVAH